MNFEFKKSDGFKIKLSKEQINQLSTMEKISKAIKDEDVIAFDIYQENNLVGFVMLKKCDNGYFLWDYAIDINYQNLGFGESILRELIDILKNKYQAIWISTTYKFGNEIARHLYEKVGFVETDIVNENNVHEVNMRLNLIDDVEN